MSDSPRKIDELLTRRKSWLSRKVDSSRSWMSAAWMMACNNRPRVSVPLLALDQLAGIEAVRMRIDKFYDHTKIYTATPSAR